jgi:hypothetical protein
MEILILLIILAVGCYSLVYAIFRDDLKDLRYRQKTAEWERQKMFWAHTFAAKRLGVDIESEEWFRAVQEEEAEFERQHPFDRKHKGADH